MKKVLPDVIFKKMLPDYLTEKEKEELSHKTLDFLLDHAVTREDSK
jgi:hypothetical protein